MKNFFEEETPLEDADLYQEDATEIEEEEGIIVEED